jgi:hypothetical protein
VLEVSIVRNIVRAFGITFLLLSVSILFYSCDLLFPTETYSGTYHANEADSGSVPVDSNEYEEGQEFTVRGNTGNLEREGYTFGGWNTQADGEGTDYASGYTFFIGTESITLYVNWINIFTVTYHGNGNESGAVPNDSNQYEEGQEVTVRGNTGSLVKAGHTFGGWNSQADGEGTDYAVGSTYIVSEDVNLYANWELPEYSLEGKWKSMNEDDKFSEVSSTIKTFDTVKYEGKSIKDRMREYEESNAIIVRFHDDIERTRELDSQIGYFGKEISRIDKPDFKFSRIEIDKTRTRSIEEIIQFYNNLPEVKYAEKDYIVSSQTVNPPNDPLYFLQWNFIQLNMPSAWSIESGETSVTVAVIDTGIAENISDFVWTNFSDGWNFVGNNANTYDDNWHGTHLAGTIAQTTNNNHGVAGMAYGVSLMPIKVLGYDGSGWTSDVAAGVIWAADNGADVINLSLGGGPYNQTMYDALKYAYEQKGVTIVAASGNDGSSSIIYPAAYEEFVIAVGASNNNKQRAWFSNYGPELDVVAPGVDILQQTVENGSSGFYYSEGTSMATPHVSALVALLLSNNNDLSQSEIYTAITDTAEDLGTTGRNDYFGYGLINPVAALQSTTPVIVYDISDSLSVLFDYTKEISDEWYFQADKGEIQLLLTSESPDIKHLDMTLYDNEGSVVVSTVGTGEKEIVYDVGDNGGLFSVRVHTNE